MSDIYQFFGRGSRSQGHGEGSIYSISTGQGVNVYKAIKANEGKKNLNFIPVAMLFFKNCKEMTDNELELIANLYNAKAETLDTTFIEE